MSGFSRTDTSVASGFSRTSTDHDERLVLPNHRRVRIRPLRRCEVETVRELYAHLSPRTRYLRFFTTMPVLPAYMERLLACVDAERGLALVAEHDGANGTEAIALGSFVGSDEAAAEVGLVVSDEWQRQRLGTALASRLLRAAAQRGHRQFIVHVLADNVAIRKLLRSLGDVVSSKMSGAVSEMMFVPRREPAFASTSHATGPVPDAR